MTESSAVLSARRDSARRAASIWRRASVEQRVEALRGVWRELAARRSEIVAVVREETGQPSDQIELLEIDSCSLLVKRLTAESPRLLADRPIGLPWFCPNKRSFVRRLPRGIAGLICSWNRPFLVPCGDAFAAMLAGNAVLLKPSEWTTKTALWLEGAVAASGLLPEGLFSVVPGGADAGEGVLDACDVVLFSGSTATGQVVAARAAAQLKPAIFELGARRAMIVLSEAPLERAASAAAWSAFSGAGRLRLGAERIFVEDAVYDAFVGRLRAECAALRVSLEGACDVGRLALPPLLEMAQSQLEDARRKGAQVVGGEVLDRGGLLMSPAIVLGASMEMAVMGEEAVGPVLPVMRVSRGEEALSWVGAAAPAGLAASFWSEDLRRAEDLGRLIEAGFVGVNEPAAGLEIGVPREANLISLTRAQSVMVHEWPQGLPDPWWFPYGERKTALLRHLMSLA